MWVKRKDSMSAAITENQVFGNQKATRLYNHLKTQVENQGELYIKSKFIADDVGLSPKEIGSLIPKLQDASLDLTIERWSYSGATTWRITK